MNESIVSKKTVYLEEYDVEVKCYLNIAEIQQIVNSTLKFDTWSGRKQNIIMLVMYHATNVGANKLEEIGVQKIIESGLFDAVKNNIKNYNEIQEGIEYTESFTRNMGLVLTKSGPQIVELLKLVGNRYGNKTE